MYQHQIQEELVALLKQALAERYGHGNMQWITNAERLLNRLDVRKLETKHVHGWHKRDDGARVCLGCGATETSPALAESR